MSDIGENLGVTNAAASQLIDRLVQHGYVERDEDLIDRRAKRIALTPKGEQLVRQSIEARRLWMEDLTIALTPQSQEAIIDALITLTQAALKLEPKSVDH